MLKQLSDIKIGRLVLYVVLLVVVVMLMLSLKNCEKVSIPEIPKPTAHSGGDTIDVAIEYSPSSYYDYGDSIGGINYELLQLVSQQMKRPMKFHPITNLSVSLDGLNKGNYDIVAAQFPVTEKNQAKYCFTEDVYLDKQVLVQRMPAKVQTQLDLAGDTLHVVKGSPMVERIQALSREIGSNIYVMTDNIYGPEQLFLRVVSGDIDYAVINNRIARLLAKHYPGKVDVSTSISFAQFQAWTLKKGNTKLCDELNKQLKVIKSTPNYRTICSQYY